MNTCKINQITFILSLNDFRKDLQLKTCKTMELFMDECGEVLSESEISTRDEVIIFAEITNLLVRGA